MKWKKMGFLVCLFICLGFGQRSAYASEEGKILFEQRCVACHTIGSGKRVGPDLAGVNDRRTENWLLPFIKSSQSLIRSGDKTATTLFEEFNKIVMPDQVLSDDQIRGILAHIKKSDGAVPSMQTKTNKEPKATRDDIERGRDLFQGKIRFAGNGPSCISCHHVKNDAVIGGGILAKDLTTVFSRMGGEGVRVILGGPPFPVMQRAYKDHSLAKDEIFALTSFLEQADREHAFQKPRDYGIGLLTSGLGGTVVLFGFYSILWTRRKKRSVNQGIYDRQIKSE